MNKDTFAQQLSGHEREFFLRMDALMECEDVIVRYKENSVTYVPDTNLKQQALVLRYTVKNGVLTVDLKLNFIDCYIDVIEKMPEHIKEMFRSIRHCSPTQTLCDRTWQDGYTKCGTRRTYTIDGKHYYLCSYAYYYNPDISNPDDVAYYAEIIKAEVQAVKAHKEHNTQYYEVQGETPVIGETKGQLTEDTIIGSRKISAAEFRRFFKKALGEDYEKYPVAWDVIKVSMNHKGKTLREIIEECLNPSGPKDLKGLLSESRFNHVSKSDKAFIIAFDQAMNEMGYDFGDTISMAVKYGKTGTKTRACPAFILIREDGFSLRLMLNKIDDHRQYIENAPMYIKNIFTFTDGDCVDCNLNYCHPKTYTIDGQMMRKCVHRTFYINQPSMAQLPDYLDLLTEFYPQKKSKQAQ